MNNVIKFSDFYSRRELHALAMWSDHCRLVGAEHEMMASFPAPAGHARRLLLVRSPADPDFSDRDRLVLELLRPHLYAVWQDAERRRSCVLGLTPREREVLDLVAEGYRNTEIAARLFVSVTTVHKHLQNIFRKLGVHTRTAALAITLPHARRPVPRSCGE